jgi:hypothetical protein
MVLGNINLHVSGRHGVLQRNEAGSSSVRMGTITAKIEKVIMSFQPGTPMADY